ncbi:hypothetical protein [Sorangium sp. So ce1389]|uniref:hypothetical protein n=1 Tax=Sorangium sp. So ce1389 TaxID=3133336 RepID=UPI003F6108F6
MTVVITTAAHILPLLETEIENLDISSSCGVRGRARRPIAGLRAGGRAGCQLW